MAVGGQEEAAYLLQCKGVSKTERTHPEPMQTLPDRGEQP